MEKEIKIVLKSVKVPAGAILVWKDYNIFKKLWSWITKKELPYNKIKILLEDTEFIFKDRLNFAAITPKKKYSNAEKIELLGSADNSTVVGITSIINKIRPHTFDNTLTITSLLRNKYYKYVDFNEECKTHIYSVEY